MGAEVSGSVEQKRVNLAGEGVRVEWVGEEFLLQGAKGRDRLVGEGEGRLHATR